VEVEQPAPELARRLRCRRDGLDDRDDAARRPAAPVLLDVVDRVAGGLAVELEQDAVLGTGLAARRIVVEPPRLPPRLRALEHPRPLRANSLEERREEPRRLLEVDKAYRPARLERDGERRPLVRERDRPDPRGEAITEAPVDRRLRSPQVGRELVTGTG